MKADVLPPSNAERLCQIIEGLGHDKYMNPRSIRSAELAELAGVEAKNLTGTLAAAVANGRIVVCKVTQAGSSRAINEYRRGPGVRPPEFVPLRTKRAGMAVGAPGKPLPVTTPAPALSTPRQAVDQIPVPTLLGQAQPEVAKNTGSSAIGTPTATPSPEAPAVAAPATPEPSAGVKLKKEPTTRKAPAGDVMRISLDDAGTLLLANEDGVIELDIDQVLRLGDFLHATQGVWRP